MVPISTTEPLRFLSKHLSVIIWAMFRKLRAVAWFTMVELLTHPATLLLTLAGATGTLILPLLQFQRFSEDGRLARDCGLATALLLGVALAIGSGGRLYRTLQEGAAAIAFVKPLSRTLWLWGHVFGSLGALAICLLTQGFATVLAEAFSPRYHGLLQAPVKVERILLALGILLVIIVIGAGLNRFRGSRFTLTSSLLLPCGLGLMVAFTQGVHGGIFSALVVIGMLLVQVVGLTTLLSVRISAGVMAGLTIGAFFIGLRFCGASAYVPLDHLAEGGAVPLKTILLLLPQTLSATGFFVWCGAMLLRERSIG